MKLGKYTVRIQIRPDNPAFAKYVICVGDKVIGEQFSVPSESDCLWLERDRGYATPDESRNDWRKYSLRGAALRNSRKSKVAA